LDGLRVCQPREGSNRHNLTLLCSPREY